MIVAKLMGGMGNQMFQYAAARRIAEVRKTQIKLDLSFLMAAPPDHTVIKRNYELGVLSIIESFASEPEIKDIFFKNYGKLISRFREKILPTWFVREPHFNYQDFLKKAPSRTYLDGYWQTEKYFIDIDAIIRKEFSFKIKPDSQNQAILDQIKNTGFPVSLHVRRGDYVSNPYTLSYHGLCDMEYYRNAVGIISQRIQNPHFFIFSDEPDWVKDNLEIDFPKTYIDHNKGSKSYEDMRLMSSCKHHIIANSSFSWWGAWLNPDPGKIVIAPRKWFNNDQVDSRDLIPETWIKL